MIPFYSRFLFYFAFALAGSALFSSCAVYVPTVPSTPLVRKANDVEITAGLRSLSSLEASAAWAPTSRLLLTAEGAMQDSNGSETRNNVTTNYTNTHRQFGLGLGTYRLLGPDSSAYLGAVGGVGFAAASIHDNQLEGYFLIIPLFGPLIHFEANYLRYYGQVYAANQDGVLTYGASARATFVDYTRLKRNGEDIASGNHFFLEPTLFMRFGRGPFQGQATLGVSMPLTASRFNPDHRNLAPATTLIGAAVVFRPHLLRKRD
jgi:hypothetical protein